MYVKLIVLLFLLFSLSASADGISRNGVFVGGADGIYNSTARSGPPPMGCSGVLDLSSGCSQLVAYGALF